MRWLRGVKQADVGAVGGKAANLGELARAEGVPVPVAFVITTAAYDAFVRLNNIESDIVYHASQPNEDDGATFETAAAAIRTLFQQGTMPQDLAAEMHTAYRRLAEEDGPAVAVRSSATAEDLPGASFAGQQETYLNVRDAEAFFAAVRDCWASLWTGRALAYRARQGIDSGAVSMAVVVQAMAPADAAGILFTANPVTGARDEMVINAAWGLGEAIVGGRVNPDTLVADKSTGLLKLVDVADKNVMTVPAASGVAEIAVPDMLRRARVLSDAQVTRLVELGQAVESHFGMPQDIEWSWGDGEFAILQARPITALPGPEVALLSEWHLPDDSYAAMRNNIVELMANPLTPLFDTLGRAAINSSLNRLLASFFGKPGPMPDEPIISINQYAYYDGSLSPKQIGEILLASVGITRRMFTGAVERWTDVGRPRYVATVERWRDTSWQELPTSEILSAVRELTEAAIEAYGALVSGVIPAAWISEGLFTLVYDKLLRRPGDPPAPTYLLGFDSAPIRAEKVLYDLTEWTRSRYELAAYVQTAPADHLGEHLMSGRAPSEVDPDEWEAWQGRFRSYLEAYGHMIYDLDFANPVPADDPAPLLETCKLFVSGAGTNPYERQAVAAGRREQATRAMVTRLRGPRLKLWRRLLEPAQRYAPLREDGLADVGLAYPVLRQMLREVGRRLAGAGMIEAPDDIFWLREHEVAAAATSLERGDPLEARAAVVADRKASWRAAKRVTPPLMLYRFKFHGLGIEGAHTPRTQADQADMLEGVAASPGRVTASASVLRGPEDFARMEAGSVLVAAITTPAWTPLFARAAAVVTDVGGPLSHGSIVAREYGIPAVLGTGSATTLIAGGQSITVDGSAGRVYLDG